MCEGVAPAHPHGGKAPPQELLGGAPGAQACLDRQQTDYWVSSTVLISGVLTLAAINAATIWHFNNSNALQLMMS